MYDVLHSTVVYILWCGVLYVQWTLLLLRVLLHIQHFCNI